MKSVPSFLGRSLALSLVLHALAIAALVQLALPTPRVARSTPAELKVSLREPLVVPETPPLPTLLLPKEAPRNANAAAPARPSRPADILVAARSATPAATSRPDTLPRLEGAAAAAALEQLKRELPYPPEAIERGLQGEAVVLLFLDASGNAIAARLEASSGHALLDDAALRAARSLRSLPASAPREALLPVRFRLR